MPNNKNNLELELQYIDKLIEIESLIQLSNIHLDSENENDILDWLEFNRKANENSFMTDFFLLLRFNSISNLMKNNKEFKDRFGKLLNGFINQLDFSNTIDVSKSDRKIEKQ